MEGELTQDGKERQFTTEMEEDLVRTPESGLE